MVREKKSLDLGQTLFQYATNKTKKAPKKALLIVRLAIS
jgi:hypothetical protein